MLFDLGNQIASDYAPTAVATNINTASYIDLLVAQEEFAGNQLCWYTICTTAPTSGGAATLLFSLIGNPSDPTFVSGNVTILQMPIAGATAYTNITLNKIITNAPIPRQTPTSGSLETTPQFLRYLTLAVTIGTAVLTAGKFSSWIAPRPMQDDLSYAAGYSFP